MIRSVLALVLLALFWSADALAMGKPRFATRVEATALFDGSADFAGDALRARSLQIKSGVKPWAIAGGRLSLGIDYEQRGFDGGEGLLSEPLHDLTTSLLFMKPTSESTRWLLRLAPSIGASSDRFGASALGLSGFVLWVKSLNAYSSFSLGVVADQSRGELSVYPGIGYISEPAPNWLLKLVMPAPEIRYAASPATEYVAFFRLSGNAWAVQSDSTGKGVLHERGVRAGVAIEREWQPALWWRAEAGGLFNRSLKLENAADDDFKTALDNSAYVGLTLYWRTRIPGLD